MATAKQKAEEEQKVIELTNKAYEIIEELGLDETEYNLSVSSEELEKIIATLRSEETESEENPEDEEVAVKAITSADLIKNAREVYRNAMKKDVDKNK